MEVDELIIATGASERRRLVDEKSDVRLLTPRQLLDMDTYNSTSAIVVSDGRGQAGLVAAEWLVARGARVEIVTEDIAVGNGLDPTNRNAWYQRLGQAGVIMSAQLEPVELGKNELQLKNVYTQQLESRDSIDLVVDWSGCHAVDDLLSDSSIKNASARWHAIGDCLAPRNVEVAMAEALTVVSSF